MEVWFPRDRKTTLLWGDALPGIFWTTCTIYGACCFIYVMVFLANVLPAEGEKWLEPWRKSAAVEHVPELLSYNDKLGAKSFTFCFPTLLGKDGSG